MDFKKTRLWQQDFICVCGRFKGEGSSFVCEGSGPIMAMQLERHLKASQTFLDGVKTLPNFREIQIKQHGELCRCLAKVDSLSTEVSGRLLSLLDHALWGDYADQVKQDIVARTGNEDTEAGPRRLRSRCRCCWKTVGPCGSEGHSMEHFGCLQGEKVLVRKLSANVRVCPRLCEGDKMSALSAS